MDVLSHEFGRQGYMTTISAADGVDTALGFRATLETIGKISLVDDDAKQTDQAMYSGLKHNKEWIAFR